MINPKRNQGIKPVSAQAHLVEDDFIYFNVAPEFTLNPSGHAPLAGVIRFSTSIRTTAEIRVSDGERDWTIPTSKAFGFDHDYIVLGLRAGRRHHVRSSDFRSAPRR